MAEQARTRAAGTAKTAKRASRQVAGRASSEGRQVADQAAQQSRELASTVREQASAVGEELVGHGQELVSEAGTRLQGEASAQTGRLAEALDQLGRQASALAAGRPSEAGALGDYVEELADALRGAARRVGEAADDVDSRGLTALISDLEEFGRRRPGAFLLGACIAGFGIGRVLRGATASPQRSR